MIRGWPFDRGQLFDRGLSEPGEFCEWHQQLLIIEKQPEAVS
jgi:hypothetical protein